MVVFEVIGDEAMRALGGELVSRFGAGEVVFLKGELGAGKTTLVRGMMEALGFEGGVRSPTFTILQVYETVPPVVHADFYRVKGLDGIGLEDYLDDYLVLAEWPERVGGELVGDWELGIEFMGEGRRVELKKISGE